MKPFAHLSATSIQEALELLAKYKGKARLIAGGTDLIPLLKRDSLPSYPEVLIDLKTIGNLSYIKDGADGLKIGALTKLEEVVRSPIVKEKYRILLEAASSVGTPQIRNMGTIGGNLCQDLRCWYYRYPHQIGGRLVCYLKGGQTCYALTGDNRYHSLFECYREEKRPSACSMSCPAKVGIPFYINKIRSGNLEEACQILLDSNPLASITGRVCPHFCEQDCSRSHLDEPVAIRELERFLGDYALERADKVLRIEVTPKGKHVAIVGSGPAGLSAAYYLRKCGYDVTIFEKDSLPGGLLRFGIPSFRLPKKVVDDLIEVFRKVLGVDFQLKTEIGKDLSLQELMAKFDAVFVAAGAYREAKMGIPGEELLTDGLDFLKKVNSGSHETPGKTVAVVGGGNTAIDVARVLLRIGAKPTILYRRTESEMPALKEEVLLAKEEGVQFRFLTVPYRAEKNNNKITLKCLKVALGGLDETGRPTPLPIEGSDFILEYDAVIKATGELPNTYFIPSEFLDDKGAIKADIKTGFVGQNLFAGGDFLSGPATVVEALATGRNAALAIDRFLSGKETSQEESRKKPLWDRINSAHLEPTKRITIPKTPVEKRSMDVEDVTGLSLSEVKTEAMRCINCGCVAVNPSDIAVALMALDAKVRLIGADGEKIVSIGDFFESPQGPIADYQILTEILIPPVDENTKQAFLKFRLRDSIDFAIASVGICLTVSGGICQNARIVLGSVSPRPFRATLAEDAIRGKTINEETAEAAAQMACTYARPLKMNGHKVRIIASLVKRALLSKSY